MKTTSKFIGLLLMPATGLAGQRERPGTQPAGREPSVTGCFGTYDAAPRRPDGHVDTERLVRELTDLRANTYNWLVAHAATDWEDLQAFLPDARKRGLRVWVSLVPPSESPPHTKHYSEPFRLDYQRWAVEIARLSVREPALVAWSIDDFAYNATFTPEYVRDMLGQARKINPRLAFVPCIYYRQLTPDFARRYGSMFDGILFPYRHESAGADLTHADTVEQEVTRIRELLPARKPVIVDVYATRHSRLGPSTPAYVEQVMLAARRSADGVLIYCHQDPTREKEKYQVIRKLFRDWNEFKTRN